MRLSNVWPPQPLQSVGSSTAVAGLLPHVSALSCAFGFEKEDWVISLTFGTTWSYSSTGSTTGPNLSIFEHFSPRILGWLNIK